MADTAGRAMLAARVLPHVDAERRTTILAQTLREASSIADDRERIYALLALAPWLQGDVLTVAMSNALAATANGRERFTVRWSFDRLIQHLPQSLLGRALDIARSVDDFTDRVRLLSSIARRLPAADRRRVVREATELSLNADVDDMATAFVHLQSLLPERRRRDIGRSVLSKLKECADTTVYADTAVRIAPFLAVAERSEITNTAFAKALRLQGFDRVSLLRTLTPILPPELVLIAFSLAEMEGADPGLLAELAPRLPEELMSRALTAASPPAEGDWIYTPFVALAPHLPIALLENALSAIERIARPGYRAESLAALVPRLDGHLQKRALEEFINVSRDLQRSDFLRHLPAFLPIVLSLDGVTGLREIRRAVLDTAAWLP